MKTLKELREYAIQASDAYYNGNPVMTDAEFDDLIFQIKSISPNDPILYTIGAPIPQNSSWKKAKHNIPMGSLEKVNSSDELQKWLINNYDVVVSEKLDGISINLEYQNGSLIQAITRGDGINGEDITTNVLKMQGVKTKLNQNYTGSIRGEIIFKQKDFEQLCEICEMRNERAISNMRNGASGIAKRRDGKYQEFLSIQFYDCTGDFRSKTEKFEFIESLELETSKWFLVDTYADLLELYNNYDKTIRSSLDHEIDGLVVEFNSIETQKQLGYINLIPKFARAWKFGAVKKETVLHAVMWQVGNGGRITPVAVFDPIQLGGATISRATLHNLENFQNLHLAIGDKILVSRRNDVIPYVESVLEHCGKVNLTVPIICPVCNFATEIIKEQVEFLYCSNPTCKSRELGNLIKWIRALDLKGIAEKTIEKLYERGYLKNPADFYKLKYEDIATIEGFKSKSINNVLDTIHSKKTVTLSEFIGGLNIPNFGKRMAELLVDNNFKIIEDCISASINDLVKIKGIEEKTAKNFINILEKKHYIIKELLEFVSIKEESILEIDKIGGCFREEIANKSFVFTGAIQRCKENGKRFKRKELQDLVKNCGGNTPSSISKAVDYLVQVDATVESTKSKQAKSLGIKIISEDEFFEMIGMIN